MDTTLSPTATGPTSPTTPPPATAGGRALSSDFQTFLRMLTTQVQNQDPLNPVDSADFAVQLATFSSVEQQVLTNELLRGLAGQLALSGMAAMGDWVGREVRAAMPVDFRGSPITVMPNPAAIADRVELVVRDAAGTEVQRLPLPVSADPVLWAGVAADGSPMPPGLYSFEVVSRAGGEVILTEPAEVYARVREVRSSGGALMLVFDGGVSVAPGAVTALRAPAQG